MGYFIVTDEANEANEANETFKADVAKVENDVTKSKYFRRRNQQQKKMKKMQKKQKNGSDTYPENEKMIIYEDDYEGRSRLLKALLYEPSKNWAEIGIILDECAKMCSKDDGHMNALITNARLMHIKGISGETIYTVNMIDLLTQFRRVGMDKFMSQSLFQALPPKGHRFMRVMMMILMKAIESKDHWRIGRILGLTIKDAPMALDGIKTIVKERFMDQMRIAQMWYVKGLIGEVNEIAQQMEVYSIECEFYMRLGMMAVESV